MKLKLPRSLRKYVRKEKAQIRRQVLDIDEQKKLIDELYIRLSIKKFKNEPKPVKENENTRDFQPVSQ